MLPRYSPNALLQVVPLGIQEITYHLGAIAPIWEKLGANLRKWGQFEFGGANEMNCPQLKKLGANMGAIPHTCPPNEANDCPQFFDWGKFFRRLGAMRLPFLGGKNCPPPLAI